MVANSLFWTTKDLEALPDDGGWSSYEIIDWELFCYWLAPPHIRHQGVACKIYLRLENWSEETETGRAFQTPCNFQSHRCGDSRCGWASNAKTGTRYQFSGTFHPRTRIDGRNPSPPENKTNNAIKVSNSNSILAMGYRNIGSSIGNYKP